jgi:hypothetical protein
MRKRIALSATSLVLVAVATTAAFKVTSNSSGTPHPTTGSPHVTVSSSPSPTAAPSTAPSSPIPSSPVASSPSTSSSPSSSKSTVADPHQVVDAAWLAADQLPFANNFRWKVMQANPQGSSPIGQQLTPTVFYVANDTSFQTLTMCADPAKLLPRTIGAQHSDFTATAGSGNNQASQYIFFFADAASAQQTYTWLQRQYSSSCLLNGSGATVTKTAGDGAAGAAWRTLKGSSTLPDLPGHSREYFVLRGSTIAFVSMTSYTSSLPTSYDDATQLATIAAHLCVYGGPCN